MRGGGRDTVQSAAHLVDGCLLTVTSHGRGRKDSGRGSQREREPRELSVLKSGHFLDDGIWFSTFLFGKPSFILKPLSPQHPQILRKMKFRLVSADLKKAFY